MVTSPVLAEELGVSRRLVSKLAKSGVLSCDKSDNGSYLFDMPTAIKEYEAYVNGTDDDGIDWNVERVKEDARCKRLKADMMQIQFDEMEGKYIRSEFVRDATNDLIFAFRSAALSLPGKLAPVIAGKTDKAVVASLIKSEVVSMLDDLTRYEFDPAIYKERLAEVNKAVVLDAE